MSFSKDIFEVCPFYSFVSFFFNIFTSSYPFLLVYINYFFSCVYSHFFLLFYSFVCRLVFVLFNLFYSYIEQFTGRNNSQNSCSLFCKSCKLYYNALKPVSSLIGKIIFFYIVFLGNVTQLQKRVVNFMVHRSSLFPEKFLSMLDRE